MLKHFRSSFYTLIVPLILLSVLGILLCKIAKNPTLLQALDFRNAQSCQLSDVLHAFIYTIDTTMSFLYRDGRDGEIIGMLKISIYMD